MSAAAPQTRLMLVWHAAPEAEVALGEDCHPLAPGLFLVRAARSRSRLYHAVKRQLPEGTALLVAGLDEAPKFSGMAAGAMKWAKGAA